MTAKEKRLFTIMLFIFLGYMLPFVIIPAGARLIDNYRQNLAQIENDFVRYQQLGQAAQMWEEAHRQASDNLAKVNAGLLQGGTQDLVAARLQGILRDVARQHQLNVQSMAVPEFNLNPSWMLVTQSVQLQTDSASLINYLQALNNAPERLIVVYMDVRVGQNNRLNVDMKVTGFSRLIEMLPTG
ncbi:hypothetical protein TPSD3_11140 [Thioflexithrix psekupsensis]|uniref:General secretion pathway protein GspM n=2 Tax=Thioflexithrix psekupsensis TaxID=1570016 RepID=A0A251X7L8_9GAMM|nr:hypothetical protein TPSD3_11140 [Thioflexithrix psekupsensis]